MDEAHSKLSFGLMGHIPERVLEEWYTFHTEFWMDWKHITQYFGWMWHIPDRVLDGWGTFGQSFGWSRHFPVSEPHTRQIF